VGRTDRLQCTFGLLLNISHRHLLDRFYRILAGKSNPNLGSERYNNDYDNHWHGIKHFNQDQYLNNYDLKFMRCSNVRSRYLQ
jgi:hypothetical protein